MKAEKPRVIRLSDVKTDFYKDGVDTQIASNEAWDLGMYFMEPGMDTIVFSLEEEDDGTAEEWYGASYEFYFILVGEFTVWYGKDAEQLRKKVGPCLVLKAGELASYPPGWKYLVQNIGKIPGTFFWGKSAVPKGVTPRENPALKSIE